MDGERDRSGADSTAAALISAADADHVAIRGVDANRAARLGFVADEYGAFRRAVADEAEKGRVLMALRDDGFCFSSGREWNPAQVFAYLRDKGLVHGSYTIIGWHRPGVFSLRRGA